MTWHVIDSTTGQTVDTLPSPFSAADVAEAARRSTLRPHHVRPEVIA